MGYDLHITRAASWIDSSTNPIDRAEWATYAHNHPALAPAGWIDWTDIGRESVYECADVHGSAVSLAWRNDHVYVYGFNGEDSSRLLAIASDLGAYLVGDEGERYTTWGSVDAE